MPNHSTESQGPEGRPAIIAISAHTGETADRKFLLAEMVATAWETWEYGDMPTVKASCHEASPVDTAPEPSRSRFDVRVELARLVEATYGLDDALRGSVNILTGRESAQTEAQ
jgi:hypothetical protein